MEIIKSTANWIKCTIFKRSLTLAIVGIENTGKTCLCNSLCDEEFEEEYFPTIGFNIIETKIVNVSLKIWDLGGNIKYRENWEKFCRSSDAIIFAVDSSDLANIDQAKMCLLELLCHPTLVGIPLCIVGTKNDKEGCFTEEELIVQLELDSIENREIACFVSNYKNKYEILKKWIIDVKKRKIPKEYKDI